MYGESDYRYQVSSLEGCVQLLASNILPHGYWFYVCGQIPADKDPVLVDTKLLSKYGIALSRQERSRRKKLGRANLHYVRWGRAWYLLATRGQHRFFEEEGANIRDVRSVPIKMGDYSLSVKRGQFLLKRDGQESAKVDGRMRVRVQIARPRYLQLCDHFESIACHRTPEQLAAELWSLPFEAYAPIRRQFLNMLRLINARRQMAGKSKIPTSVLRYQRRIVKAYAENSPAQLEAA